MRSTFFFLDYYSSMIKYAFTFYSWLYGLVAHAFVQFLRKMIMFDDDLGSTEAVSRDYWPI